MLKENLSETPSAATTLQVSHQRTAIKICGLTREEDVHAAVQQSVQAIGFVMYAQSPRAVTLNRAIELAQLIPPFITPVLLFVNADPEDVHQAIKQLPRALLQFHGDETPAYCAQFNHPYIRAARIKSSDSIETWDLLQFATEYSDAQAILLDAHTDAYGGSGKTFDWAQIQQRIAKPLILGGGLHSGNVHAGIQALRPFATHLSVDVSSGVEAQEKTETGMKTIKGIKDARRVQEFVAAVHAADLAASHTAPSKASWR